MEANVVLCFFAFPFLLLRIPDRGGEKKKKRRDGKKKRGYI